MSHYNAIGRFLSPLFVRLIRIHTRITQTPRTRVIVLNEHGEVLLVRSWVGIQQWELPGGAPKPSETAKDAGKRELFEETGIFVDLDQLHYETTIHDDYEASIYRVVVAKSQLPSRPYSPREISAIRWCGLDTLPSDTSGMTIQALRNIPKTPTL